MYKVTVPTIITNGHFNKEKTLTELKRCNADRIALAVNREVEEAFSSQESLMLLKENLDYFRKNGFETLVWLGETIGHTFRPVIEGAPYRHIYTLDHGETNSFCPLDENFRKDFSFSSGQCRSIITELELGGRI